MTRPVSTTLRLLTLLAGWFALSPLLSAQVSETQVTTLTKSDYSYNSFFHDITTNSARGFLFTTDNQSYTLDNIVIEMRRQQAGELRAYLSVWSGGDPWGSPIDFTNSFINSSMRDVVFTPESEVLLDPNVTYAMHLTIPTLGPAFDLGTVSHSDGYDTPAGNAWILPSGALTSSDGGGTWSQIGSGSARLSFSVQATATSAVPEPATYAAVAGLIGLIAAVWRRRMRRA